MNRYKKLIAFLLCCISIAPCTFVYSGFFDEIDGMFDRQHKRMEKIRRKFTKNLEHETKESMTVLMQEKNGNAIVTINNLETESKTFNAEFNSSAQLLTITTPAGIMKLMTRDNFLSVQFSYQQRKETKKDTEQGFYMSSGASQIGKTLSAHPRLAEVSINYDPETKALTIIVPLEKMEKTKALVTKIPVHVK